MRFYQSVIDRNLEAYKRFVQGTQYAQSFNNKLFLNYSQSKKKN